MNHSQRSIHGYRIHDRVAHQFALMLTCIIVLLVSGGFWWLVAPSSAAAGRSDHGFEPLFVLGGVSGGQNNPAAMSRPQLVVPKAVADPGVSVSAASSTPVARTPREAVTFNGRPLRKLKTVRMLVTGYSPDERSCGKSADNITASGYTVWTNAMKMVAADTRILPFGSVISVPGYDGGQPVPVLDRGGAIKGMRLDLLYPTHESALRWGKKWVDVTVWEYAD